MSMQTDDISLPYETQECPKDYRIPQAWQDIHDLRTRIFALEGHNTQLAEALTLALRLLNKKSDAEK